MNPVEPCHRKAQENMIRWLSLFLISILIGTFFSVTASQIIYECDFSLSKQSDWIFSKYVKPIALDGIPMLKADVPADCASGMHVAFRPVDLKLLRNKILLITFQIKAENVTKPPQPYNGVKIMFYLKTKTGEVWRNPIHLHGSFDWREIQTGIEIPPHAERARLIIGLQESSGTLLVRNIRITSYSPKEVYPPIPLPENFQAEYSRRVMETPPLRGVMGPDRYHPQDMEELSSWGATLIRWQLKRNWGKSNTERDLREYMAWLYRKLDELDRVLDHCRELGIKVIIDLHTPPGGRNSENDMAMFYEPVYAEAFLKIWEVMATRYKAHPALWAYDLLNEPTQSKPAQIDYLTLQFEAAKRIRAIDPETPIIVESNNWAVPYTFNYLSPLPLRNIIYQAHMYEPGAFTHQGVGNTWGVRGSEQFIAWPGIIRGVRWNRETLRERLRPVRLFQQKYGARIYIGEFSAARWSPGAARYLEDVISIFEEFNWDWSYHSFRESQVWSVEHSTDRFDFKRSVQDTDRKRILLKYFKRNAPN